MHGKARLVSKDQCAVVANTHEAIIGAEQWERVRSLLQRDTRTLNFKENVSPPLLGSWAAAIADGP